MSCDQTAWAAATQQYGEDMALLQTACLGEQQAEADVEAAELALSAAQTALATAQQAHESAKQRASQSQLLVVTESEKLGVACECPTIPPPETAAFKR